MNKKVISRQMKETLDDIENGKPLNKVRHLVKRDYVKPASRKEVKAVRKYVKLTQRGLADWLGVSIQAVRVWEQGQGKPGVVISKILRLVKLKKGFFEEFSNSELSESL